MFPYSRLFLFGKIIEFLGAAFSRWHHVRAGFRVRRRLWSDSGMSTAEYAIGTIAAAALAGVLYLLVTSDSVESALTELVQRALSVDT
jgi:ABC-type nitrate/sulfonate/bicarbonate transport system permease component